MLNWLKKVRRRKKSDRAKALIVNERYMERTERLSSFKEKGLKTGVSSIMGTRKYQQDAAKVVASNGTMLAVLCDGMGGMQGGALASNLCVDMVCGDFQNWEGGQHVKFLCQEVQKLDVEVANLRDEKGSLMRSGTTMLMVMAVGNLLYWVSIGDSRIYIIRDNEIEQVTKDHNLFLRLKAQAERNVITMEEARNHPEKEALISYVGMGDVSLVEVNEHPFELRDGDQILMCSDGLYKILDEPAMLQLIKLCPDDMEEAAHTLTTAAANVCMGSQDNTTVIVMKYNQ